MQPPTQLYRLYIMYIKSYIRDDKYVRLVEIIQNRFCLKGYVLMMVDERIII